MITPHEKTNLLNSLQRAYEEAEKMPTTTSCMDCKLFDGGFCKIWKETIPQEAIPDGCDKWIFDPNAPPF